MGPEHLAGADIKRNQGVKRASNFDVAEPSRVDRDAGTDPAARLTARPEAGRPETVAGGRVEGVQPARLQRSTGLGADPDQEQALVEHRPALDRRLQTRRLPVPDPVAGQQLEGVKV